MPWPAIVISDLSVFVSQTFEVSSSLVLIKRVPCALNHRALMFRRCAPFIETEAPVLTSQIRISAFSEPLAILSPFGLQATAWGGMLWPWNVWMVIRVLASIIRIELSARATANLVPAGADARARASNPRMAPAGVTA